MILIITGMMVITAWAATTVGDERPYKKRDRGVTTRPADPPHDRSAEPHGRKFKGGRPHGDRDFDRPRYGRGMGPGGPPDPRQMEEFMKFAEKEFPLLADRMKQAREKHPRGMMEIKKRIGELMRLRRENPELAEKVIAQHRNEMKVADLHRQYRHARTQEERDAIAGEIRAEMETGFELRIERLRLEIDQLEKRLNEAKQNLVNQEQNKSTLIEEQFQKLIAEKVPTPPKRP
jgi:hypothetical protein